MIPPEEHYMPYGYNGKTLRVNLTESTIKTEEPPEIWYRAYLGGMGAIAYHLLKETSPGVDPLVKPTQEDTGQRSSNTPGSTRSSSREPLRTPFGSGSKTEKPRSGTHQISGA
jgi:hypothetical protein